VQFDNGITVEVIKMDTDKFGDRAESTVSTIPNCMFAPSSSVEDNAGRTQVDRTASLIVGAGYGSLLPSASARVRVPGRGVWEVDGYPDQWTALDGTDMGGEIQLRRVIG
jgi:hypothetical protein